MASARPRRALRVSAVLTGALTGAAVAEHGDSYQGYWGDHGYCAQHFDANSVHHTMHDEPSRWVDAHNHYRRCHGAPDVVWDASLVPYAQAWTQELLVHCDGILDVNGLTRVGPSSEHRPHDPMGFEQDPPNAENLAIFGSALSFNPISQAPLMSNEATVAEGWYREVEVQCPDEGWSSGCGGVLNHFTAMTWRSVTRIGCYSAARGNFKVVSCRYAADPSSSAASKDCATPNTVGCDEREVPALGAGRCGAFARGRTLQVPLRGWVGDLLEPVLNPKGVAAPGPGISFAGTWMVSGGQQGSVVITQDLDDIQMTSNIATWSSFAHGTISSGSVVHFDMPPQMSGVSGQLLENGQRMQLSTGDVLLRQSTRDQEAAIPTIVIGIPTADMLPDSIRQVVVPVADAIDQAFSWTAAAASGGGGKGSRGSSLTFGILSLSALVAAVSLAVVVCLFTQRREDQQAYRLSSNEGDDEFIYI